MSECISLLPMLTIMITEIKCIPFFSSIYSLPRHGINSHELRSVAFYISLFLFVINSTII